ncbi:MAG TPA: type II toxin-antitoxin system VapC family toxin [Longimicrobium sp.]|nr:type II toxin-antitoxin system VapC family toxin [Longimicrobium sp.]
MDRPTLYIETSIVSYLAADPSRHPVTLRNQQLTHRWWNTRRQDYALFTSKFVVDEVARGDPGVAQQRLALLTPLAMLASEPAVLEFAEALQRFVPLPVQAREDAFHIATAAVNGMTYLLTWNCKHIANPRLGPRIERICSSWGYSKPMLCTPEEMLRGE